MTLRTFLIMAAALSLLAAPAFAQQQINIGSASNDGTGDPLRTAFGKINTNALLARYAQFPATRYGAKCDGSTDDTAAIQAAESAANAAGGGLVVLPDSGNARCIVSASILWDSGVGMIGAGRSVSGLKWASGVAMSSTAGAMILCRGITGGTCPTTSSAPTIDFILSDLELDVSGATVPSYDPKYKAVFFQHMLRPLVTRTWIHDAPATCLGIDFLVQGRISDNILTGCGRLATSTSFGGSGIGIGTGSDTGEGVLITGNTVWNATRYGIFVESQTSGTASNARVVISNNNCLMTAATGECIGDAGNTSTDIIGNRVTQPASTTASVYAISVDTGTVGSVMAVGGNISDNIVTGGNSCFGFNGQSTTLARYTFSNNICSGAYSSGFNVALAANVTVNSLWFTSNKSYNNGTSGYIFNSSASSALLKNLVLVGNIADANGGTTAADYAKAGIALNGAFSGVTIQSGRLYDSGAATQKYGLSINTGSTVAGLRMIGVDLNGNTSAATNFLATPTASYLADNPGYNPAGMTTATIPASGSTFTNGSTPATLYLTGGVVTAVIKSGNAVCSATPCAVVMAPNDTLTLTYSSAPTGYLDRQ